MKRIEEREKERKKLENDAQIEDESEVEMDECISQSILKISREK